MFTLI